MADVLHVGEAPTFAIGFLSLVDVDAVFGNQLYIERSWIFIGFDPAGDVEPVACLLYTSPSPRDRQKSRMPSSA